MNNRLLLPVILLLIFACNNETPDSHHGSIQKDLTLNDGRKWAVSELINKDVKEMEETIETLESLEMKSIKEYNEAGNKLQSIGNQLVNDCKVTGPEHEVLHKWLMPVLDNIKKLSTTSEKQEAINAFNAIDRELHVYNVYFQ